MTLSRPDVENFSKRLEFLLRFFYLSAIFPTGWIIYYVEPGFFHLGRSPNPLFLIFGFIPADRVFDVFRILIIPSLVLAGTFPRSQLARVFPALVFFIFTTVSAYLGVSQSGRLMIMYAIIGAAFIPSFHGPGKPVDHCKIVAYFYFAGATGMITYLLSGFWKVVNGFLYGPFFEASLGYLSPRSFEYLVAGYVFTTGVEPPLIKLALNSEYWGTLLLWATTYLEVVAIVAIFRPQIARLVFYGLFGMHIGSYLFMSIIYIQAFPIILSFLFFHPLRRNSMPVSAAITELPLIGSAGRGMRFLFSKFIARLDPARRG